MSLTIVRDWDDQAQHYEIIPNPDTRCILIWSLYTISTLLQLIFNCYLYILVVLHIRLNMLFITYFHKQTQTSILWVSRVRIHHSYYITQILSLELISNSNLQSIRSYQIFHIIRSICLNSKLQCRNRLWRSRAHS